MSAVFNMREYSRRSFIQQCLLAYPGFTIGQVCRSSEFVDQIQICRLESNQHAAPLLTLTFDSLGKKFEFLVDSGSANAIIDPRSELQLEGLGVPMGSRGQLDFIRGGTISTSIGLLKLDFFAYGDLSTLSEACGRIIHGIFSIRELNNCILSVKQSCASLAEWNSSEPAAKKHILYRDGYAMLYGRIVVNNSQRLLKNRFLIDTGFLFDLAIRGEDFSRLEDLSAIVNVSKVKSVNRTGISDRRLGIIESVQFLGNEHRQVKVLERDEGQLIGMPMLLKQDLVLSFATAELWVPQ